MLLRLQCNRLKQTVIDIGTVNIRAQRVIGKHRFPHSRGEGLNPAGRVLTDSLQHIDEIGVWVNAVQATGGEQALNDADAFSADFGPVEQP